MSRRRRNAAIKRALVTGATIATLIIAAPLASNAPTSASAKGTRIVKSDCCSLRAPRFLNFAVNGDAAWARAGGIDVEFASRLSSDPVDLVDGEIDAIGGGTTSYTKSTSRWLVKSGTLYGDDTIFYIRANVDPNCDEMGLLTIRYPVSKKTQYDAAVSAMSKSFDSKNCH